jgi:hypothetical protein
LILQLWCWGAVAAPHQHYNSRCSPTHFYRCPPPYNVYRKAEISWLLSFGSFTRLQSADSVHNTWRQSAEAVHNTSATHFYKQLALVCSEHSQEVCLIIWVPQQ